MSKSLGNVVKPLDLIDSYGVDPVRYYLMRDMVLGQDASFTLDGFIRRFNSDLANDFGNLVNRVSILIRKNFDGIIPQPGVYDALDLELIAEAKAVPMIVRKLIENLRIHEAIETTIAMLRGLNRYLEIREPWKSIKEDKSQGSLAATTLFLSADILRIGAQLLHPVMPSRIETILAILGADDLNMVDFSVGLLKPGTKLGAGKSPFPRIETTE